MARIGITFGDVARAAKILERKGDHLTIENIRGILGTGSNSTIGRHIHTLKGRFPGKAATAPEVSKLIDRIVKLEIKVLELEKATTMLYKMIDSICG